MLGELSRGKIEEFVGIFLLTYEIIQKKRSHKKININIQTSMQTIPAKFVLFQTKLC